VRDRTGRVSLLAIVVLVAAACGGMPAESETPTITATPFDFHPETPDPWAALARPVELPSIEPGDACPTTQSTMDLEGVGPPLLGDGPIYPALGPDGIVTLGFNDRAGTTIDGQDWWEAKVLWVSDDPDRGIGLIRGGRIDADGDVWFYPGNLGEYVSEMRLTVEAWVYGPRTPGGWREWNSWVYFAEPGCYAFQIDGEDFTDIVVVQVTA
jgi:hypothetical protein